MADKIHFEEITPLKIIDFSTHLLEYNLKNKKPIELVKTEYITGQTIVLKGNKTDYDNLIEFWLSTQTWYGSEGMDNFYATLIVDELWNYTQWQLYSNRVGICKVADSSEKKRFDIYLSECLKTRIEQEYLIMNPNWDEEKVLFIDDDAYYLYYFWSGE